MEGRHLADPQSFACMLQSLAGARAGERLGVRSHKKRARHGSCARTRWRGGGGGGRRRGEEEGGGGEKFNHSRIQRTLAGLPSPCSRRFKSCAARWSSRHPARARRRHAREWSGDIAGKGESRGGMWEAWRKEAHLAHLRTRTIREQEYAREHQDMIQQH